MPNPLVFAVHSLMVPLEREKIPSPLLAFAMQSRIWQLFYHRIQIHPFRLLFAMHFVTLQLSLKLNPPLALLFAWQPLNTQFDPP